MSEGTTTMGINNRQQAILRSLAEDIKVPLLQVLTHSQLRSLRGQSLDASYVEATTDAALKLLDSYIVTTQIYNGQQEIPLQPTSVTATMYDSAQYLNKFAKLHNCEIQLQVPRSVGLVMANPKALQAVFTSLGYSFINALNQAKGREVLVFAARRTPRGIKVGIHTPGIDISPESLQQARALQGKARQSVSSLGHGSSAGLYVADMLLSAMNVSLHTARLHATRGLGATFLPSKQLALL